MHIEKTRVSEICDMARSSSQRGINPSTYAVYAYNRKISALPAPCALSHVFPTFCRLHIPSAVQTGRVQSTDSVLCTLPVPSHFCTIKNAQLPHLANGISAHGPPWRFAITYDSPIGSYNLISMRIIRILLTVSVIGSCKWQ